MAALRNMIYLKQKYNSRLFLEPTYPLINNNTFNSGAYWKELYGDANKTIPPDLLEPRGKEVYILIMVDNDHAGYKATQYS